MRAALILWTACATVGCRGEPAEPARTAPSIPPQILTVIQRTEADLTGAELTLTIGDITGGAVPVQLESFEGDPVVARRSMRVGDSVAFEWQGRTSSLGLLRLRNYLIGEDYAEFRIGPSADLGTDQIESLLRRLEESNLTFVRNGAEHSGRKAAEHFRMKLKYAGDVIATGEDFIRHIATKSSSTGRPYLVRIGSTDVPLADWLRGSLPSATRDAGTGDGPK